MNHHSRGLRLLGAALIAPVPVLGIASTSHARMATEAAETTAGAAALQGEVLDIGDVLVTDRPNQGCGGEVMLVAPTGEQTTVASGGEFCSPWGMALEADGDVLVADNSAFDLDAGIFRVNPETGAQETVSQAGSFRDLAGIAVLADGDIVAADQTAGTGPTGTLFRIDPVTGNQTVLSTGQHFVDPAGVAVESDGDILVVDRAAPITPGWGVSEGPGSVIRVDPDTGTQTVISTGGEFKNPFAIALEADGDIVILDNLNTNFTGSVIRVDADTGEQTVVSTGGSFTGPGGIAVAADGAILVADMNAFGFGGPLGPKPGGVIRVNPDTGEQTALSSGGSFENPSGIVVSSVSTNSPPEATGEAYGTDEDVPVTVPASGVLGNDTDADPGDSLRAQLVSEPANGAVTLDADGSFVYTPAADYHGTDSFTYRAQDEHGAESAIEEVTLTVNPVSDGPAAGDDSYSTTEDTVLTVSGPGVLGDDHDPDGDTISAVRVSGPSHGTLTLDGNGSFVYTPAADYHGSDTFTYQATDGALQSDVATVSISIAEVNDAPIAGDDAYATTEDIPLTVAAPGVLGDDDDPDDDALDAVLVDAPAHGTVALDADGAFVYTPAADYYGLDSFTYRAQDERGAASEVAAVELTVDEFVDRAGPEAHPSVSPAPNAAGWHHDSATAIWNWTDDGDGVDPARCTDQTMSAGQGRIVLTASCRDLAGNESTASYAVRVDMTEPTVTVSSPAGETYLQGAAVLAEYGCGDGLSGIAACTAEVADGGQLDTATLGSHRFTVTARDRAGNERAASVTYTVVTASTCHGRTATIVGTADSDVITGTLGDDVIVTGAGRDWVRARGGDDIICTGAARDIITGGAGDDTIDTGAGRDIGYGGTGDDTVNGGDNGDILTGGFGADTLRGNGGKDNLIGQSGDDLLDGGSDGDSCRGGTGRDRQSGCEATLGIP